MAENLIHTLERIQSKSFKSWSSTETHIKVIRHRHTWTIYNYSYSSKADAKLESPIFTAGTNGMQWRLELHAEGTYRDQFSVQLVPVNCHLSQMQTFYTLGIVNTDGKDVNWMSRPLNVKERNLTENSEILCPNRVIIDKDYIFKEENKVSLDDKLTIFCEITAMVGSVSTSGTLPSSQIDLVKDFAFMLENEESCDVTLSTGGKKFPAHKFILRARSPVFRAMFQHDMAENTNNRVEITDIDDEGLGEMLRYMYTGEIHNLKQTAPRLLNMADKYQMDGLKIMCEKALLEHLSHENAAETFILSDTFRAIALKDQVKDFIAAHAAKIGNTPGFESMVRTHPHLTLDAFRVCTK